MQILGPEEMFLHVPFNVEAVDVELETGSDETSIKHVVRYIIVHLRFLNISLKIQVLAIFHFS